MRSIKEMDKRLDEREQEIERLNKELDGNKKVIDAMIDNEEEYCIEINRLNNIINELEKWLSVRIDNFNANVSEPIYHEYITIRLVYDYLQELKGEDK